MDLEITPEPTTAERAAIEAAVIEVLSPSSAPVSEWWLAGVTDGVDDAELP